MRRNRKWRNPWGEEGDKEGGDGGKERMEPAVMYAPIWPEVNGQNSLIFLCHPHCLLGSWRNFSFTFSTQNHLIFAQLDLLGRFKQPD